MGIANISRQLIQQRAGRLRGKAETFRLLGKDVPISTVLPKSQEEAKLPETFRFIGKDVPVSAVLPQPNYADFEAQYMAENPKGDMSDEEYRRRIQVAYDKFKPAPRFMQGGG